MKTYQKPVIKKIGKATKVMSVSCNGAMARNCNTN